MSLINYVMSSLDGDATVLVGVLSLLLLWCIFLRRCRVNNERRSEAPKAGGEWPIIGHLPVLSGPNMPHITLGILADKYRALFTIRLGSRRAVVISNWEMAKECFTTNDLAVSSRPTLIAIQRLSYNGAMFGFAPHGPYWQQLRKMATLELLSNRRVQQVSHVWVSELESCIKGLFKLWSTDQKKVFVDVSKCFGELAMNVVLRSICGKRYFGGTVDADVKEENGRRFLEALKEWMRLLGVVTVGDALPFLRCLDLGGHEKRMKQIAKEIDSILDQWLREHRCKRTSPDDNRTGDQDFIDVMLSFLDGSKLEGVDANTTIKAMTLALIAGGVDTTSVTLTWAMSCLLNNPHVLKEAQKELDINVGKERGVKESDISKLVYLQAVVKETLRLHPPGSLSGPREFLEDCIIGGYRITKGTRLITNLWKIQTDPRIWSDPLEFKPERFLTTHKDVDMRGQHFELIPFGSGKRICPGISYGLQAIHLSLATFLHSFEYSKPSDEPIDMTEAFGLNTYKATPLELFIKPRLSTKFYDTL